MTRYLAEDGRVLFSGTDAELAAELDKTQQALEAVMKARIEAAVEGSGWKSRALRAEWLLQSLEKANRLGVYAVPQKRDDGIWWLARTPNGNDLPAKLLGQSSHLGAYRTIQSALHWAALAVEQPEE